MIFHASRVLLDTLYIQGLPLQIHPNKELSSKLQKQDPEKFTDPNHKPEIAVALSNFEVFAGWKPLPEIQELFVALSPLHQFIPPSNIGNPKDKQFTNETLRSITSKILSAPDNQIKQVQKALANLQPTAFPLQEHISRNSSPAIKTNTPPQTQAP